MFFKERHFSNLKLLCTKPVACISELKIYEIKIPNQTDQHCKKSSFIDYRKETNTKHVLPQNKILEILIF